MASFARKMSVKYSYAVLKNTEILRPFNMSLQCCKYSTQLQPQQQATSQLNEDKTSPLVNPLKHPDFFQVHNLFTVKDLFNANVHLGHKETSVHSNMLPFIYGSRLGHLVIDLDQTAEMLRQALNFAAQIAFKDGIILFFHRNPQSSYLVDILAKECGEYSHTRYWRPGTFTNSAAQFKLMTRLPDLCIFFSTKDTSVHEHVAVAHSAKMCIPTIGIVDTNCNPNLITYPVPGNDDSLSAIQLYCKLFKQAILRGKRARERIAQSRE